MSPLSFPVGARVGFVAFEPRAPGAAHDSYKRLTIDICREMSATFPSLDPVARWRSCTDRVLMGNVYVDVGVSVGHGLAAIWMTVRDDREFRLRAAWRDRGPAARAWLRQVAPRFDDALFRLGCPAPAQHHPLAA